MAMIVELLKLWFREDLPLQGITFKASGFSII